MYRNASTHALIIAASASLASAGVPAVLSTFDTGTDGWTTLKDARDFRWEETGGNPGGFIAANDVGSGAYWRFNAPSAYHGDKSAYYGLPITYQLRQIGSVGTVTNQDDIRITGGGVTIDYRFGTTPGSEWTTFSIELVEGAGWEVSNTPATEAQIRAVLAEVTSLSIRGEYRVGADSCGLDNVYLGVPCAVDYNNDGELNFFDVSAFINAYNNNEPAADLAAPFGELNFFDVSAFIAAYNAGC